MMDLSRRTVLAWTIGLALVASVSGRTWAQAQAAAPEAAGGIVGTWQGTLHAPGGA